MIYGKRKDKTDFKTRNPETDYTALIGTLEKAQREDRGARAEAAEFHRRSCCCRWPRRCC